MMDEPTAELLLEMGTMVVPTRHAVDFILSLKGQIPNEFWEAEAAFAEKHWRSLELAIEAGIPIAVGADIMQSGDPWGTNGKEVATFVEAGMTHLEAIEAATANGPLTLGPRAPQSGILKEGYDADVIAIDTNPLKDITALGNPQRVTMVWKGGNLVKEPEQHSPVFPSMAPA